MDHFIYNVTKQDVQHAFEQAYNTFKTAFNRFCKQKSYFNEYEKLNYITFDTKNEYDIEEKQDYKNLNTYDNIYKKANKYLRIKKKIEGIEEYLLQNIEAEETIEKLRKIESIVYEI